MCGNIEYICKILILFIEMQDYSEEEGFDGYLKRLDQVEGNCIGVIFLK